MRGATLIAAPTRCHRGLETFPEGLIWVEDGDDRLGLRLLAQLCPSGHRTARARGGRGGMSRDTGASAARSQVMLASPSTPDPMPR
jgi:hypothetical protein